MYGQMWNLEQVMKMTVDIQRNLIILLIRRKHLYKLPIYNKFKILLKQSNSLGIFFGYEVYESKTYQNYHSWPSLNWFTGAALAGVTCRAVPRRQSSRPMLCWTQLVLAVQLSSAPQRVARHVLCERKLKILSEQIDKRLWFVKKLFLFQFVAQTL